MFTCIWQLWDWLDSPPLFAATMESKKLQPLQQTNLHLAPQLMPQKRALPPFIHPPSDYSPPQSLGFQNQLKYHNISSNIAQINLTATHNQNLPSSQLPAMDTTACTHQKHSAQNIYQPLPNEKLYQCPNNERTVQLTPSRSHYNSLIHSCPHPIQSLQQQYQQLQNAKIEKQIQTQSEALVQQQRTFALRQQLNPPIPQSHFHIQGPKIVQPQLQQPHLQHNAQRNVPPSTLNLSTQFQPALDPFKVKNLEMIIPLYSQDIHSELLLHSQKSQSQAIYQQNKKIQQQILNGNVEIMTPVEHAPVYIQQNHPGHVVNQACQTQLSVTMGTQIKSPVEENKNSLHQSLDKKKNPITMQSLKCPITKRPASSLVTVSGWLYKQGSDGLKVWRKRWFVLSEYCLYYYKGPEQGKLLGSILLPSYQIAACSIEDKVYRKYAFKCEHTNMRTYWLAAENAETMGKWIRALMAAAIMQGSNESSDYTSQPSVSSFNHSGENSDSGIHTFQSHQNKISLTQGSGTPASESGGIQPLYANAPPKPRRVNDGGYSSPSPENSIEPRFDTINDSRQYQSSSQHSNQNLMKSQTRQMQQPSHHQAIYDDTTGNVTSTLQMEPSFSENQKPFDNAISHPGRSSDLEPYISITPQRFQPDINDERELHIQRSINQKYGVQMNSMLGMNYTNSERRTPDAYGRSKLGPLKTFSDYEDIYNLNQHQSIQRCHQTDLTEYQRPLGPPSYSSSKHGVNQLETGVKQNKSIKNKSVKPAAIARPHSADFLEYEARADFEKNLKMDQIHSRRPKSSLDINRNQDSYYYSEASYAEKMRQSALYIQKPSNVSQLYSSCSPYGGQSSAYAIEPNHFPYDNQYYKLKKNEMKTEGNRQESLGTILKSNLKDQRIQYNEQFLRSASARLPRKDDDSIIKEGERKREESMKRLLEWKQRMLQSPLTRKSAQHSTTSISKSINSSKMMSPVSIQRSRSDLHANDSYNSYSSDDEASISIRNGRNISKLNLTVLPDASEGINQINNSNSYYTTDADSKYRGNRCFSSLDTDIQSYHENVNYSNNYNPLIKSGSRIEIDFLERETSSQIRNLDMSAGDLLSRTHEELVLLLIQLRRQNSSTARAIEQCCTDIHEIQNRIRTADGQIRSDSIFRLHCLKQRLLNFEKQYEKSKPLVNLVDNMVKLGSLYRNNEIRKPLPHYSEAATLDRFEFNKKIQERRLLQEEQKKWDRINPNHTELQFKVQQLYQLDQLLQEESGTLQNLQRDKETIERALGGLRARLQDNNGPSFALEAAKKQQHTLERELSRVHQLLAENSKKLEETVAGNARLEQELLILRQKLQATRGSQGVLLESQGGNQGTGDSIQYASSSTAILESELRRVQQLVGDMQRQRQELSQAVRQLTENSNNLYHQIGADQFNSSFIKKRLNSNCWMETDLDSMISVDHSTSLSSEHFNVSTPLYIDTNSGSSDLLNCSTSSKICENKNLKNCRLIHHDSCGIESADLLENNSTQEKQEIKTVRIVKRESDRRHRDRDRTGDITVSNLSLDQVQEEDIHSDDSNCGRSRSLPRTYNETDKQIKSAKSNDPAYLTNHLNSMNPIEYCSYPVSMRSSKEIYATDRENSTNIDPKSVLRLEIKSIPSSNKSYSDFSHAFQSEAARQIIIEMSGITSEDNDENMPLSHKHKRAVPKEKRRHYTAPHNVNSKAIQNVQTENDMNRNNMSWRAKDDLDMEVALRPRTNAPDVVRSALDHSEKISENTIDKLLAAPSKILIPERYIPEQTPELTPEEKKRRQEKVEAIKKMLSDTPINSSNDPISVPSNKIKAEKKQREHLLQLNQILAQQVMQMSKIVADKALVALTANISDLSTTTSEEDHLSTMTNSLPINQVCEHFFT